MHLFVYLYDRFTYSVKLFFYMTIIFPQHNVEGLLVLLTVIVLVVIVGFPLLDPSGKRRLYFSRGPLLKPTGSVLF